MKSNLICMLITIVAYLILMIVVGILASKKNKDTSDFYLGGRKLGPIVTAGNWHISQLAVGCKTAANLFPAQWLDYNSRLFLEPLSR